MIPTEQFWTQLAVFNSATWIIQIVWLATVLATIFLAFARRTARLNAALKLLLSFAFFWDGIVFFLMFARGPFYYFFGAPLFILIAVLFAVDIFRNKIEFKLPDGRLPRGAAWLWISAWLLYPFAGTVSGRVFPEVCTPMDPCPLTVLAIALLAAAAPKVNRALFILLLPWALLGLPKALGMYQCYEDGILFLSGVYGVIVLAVDWKPAFAPARVPPDARSAKAANPGRGE
jgi:hypothetical protein